MPSSAWLGSMIAASMRNSPVSSTRWQTFSSAVRRGWRRLMRWWGRLRAKLKERRIRRGERRQDQRMARLREHLRALQRWDDRDRC